jgi:RimJ/RimL family protein N-acetyltransferase
VKGPRRIETSRLVLSPPELSDAPDIFERYAGDPDVTRYLGWPRHRSVVDTEGFVAFSLSEWSQWPAGPYLIRSRDSRRLLGSTGLSFQSPERAMTGYVFAKDAWGQGYATEALRAMVDLAQALALPSLFALCHPDHRPSWHVLEKCGFMRDTASGERGEFPNLEPGVLQPVLCYTLSCDSR